MRQLSSVQVEFDGGQQRVDLLNEGLGGFTPGSGAVTITIGYLMPIGGTEFDYAGNVVNGAIVAMQIGLGSQSYAGNGKITNTSISQSTGASVEGTMTWVGELSAPS